MLMNSVDCIEVELVKSDNSKLQVLYTRKDEIHGIARTANDQQCIVLHGPSNDRWLVNVPYVDMVQAIYG